jgi:uncharacterized protein YbjT (DUF2867 family)
VSRVLGITGASGYIGQAVTRLASACGWQVVAIGRRPADGAQAWRLADLNDAPSNGLLDGLDALLHLAANTRGDSVSSATELSFAHKLAVQASAAGVPFVFASSQAAASDAPSDYGRTKFAIEQQITALGGVAVRPGMVIGGREAGLFGLLTSLVRASPLLPDLRPRPAVQPIHVDDLAAALLAACTKPDLRGRVLAAAGAPVTFSALLGGIGRHRLRVRRQFVPLPLFILRGLLALTAPVLGPRFSCARLDSLIQLPPLDARADLATLGIVLRPLAAALDRRGRGVRRLLLESHALSRATMGTRPTFALSRRYARILEKLGHGEALPLPTTLVARPSWLAALDTPSRRRHASSPGGLAWRMNVMIRLAETQPALSSLFLMMPDHAGRTAALGAFVSAGMRELQTRAFAPLARHLGRNIP